MSVHLRFLRVLLLGTLAPLRPGAPARDAAPRPAPAYVVVDLGVLPGGDTSVAAGINDRGQVVGYAYAADGHKHAFRTGASGTLAGQGADLGALPGSTDSEAAGINDRGQVVGVAVMPGAPRAPSAPRREAPSTLPTSVSSRTPRAAAAPPASMPAARSSASPT